MFTLIAVPCWPSPWWPRCPELITCTRRTIYGTAQPSRHRAPEVLCAYLFIPQIFFYGMSSLIGAVLNTRNRFAAPMWTPIINNVVVIAVGGLYVATAGLNKKPATISPAGVKLLGIGTTLGVVAQTVALYPSLRKAGFRWQPRPSSSPARSPRWAGWPAGCRLHGHPERHQPGRPDRAERAAA